MSGWANALQRSQRNGANVALLFIDLDGIKLINDSYGHEAGDMLVHQDGYFMQMLEGGREAIFSLMEKIKIDPRHRDVRIVFEGPTRRRAYQDWGMMLRDLKFGPDEPEFIKWQRRSIGFLELADDPRTCYAFITAYACGGIVD